MGMSERLQCVSPIKGRGCALSRAGHQQLTRPKSFHQRNAA